MGRWDDFDYYRKYTPSKPREAKNGIKAKGNGRTFGKNWWAKRWNQTLEGFNLGARLTRGRSYARSGQVLSVDIKGGSVKAKVQGSRIKPYKVDIKVRVLSAAEWDKVMAKLSQEAIFAARLLAGEMPLDIEEVFAGAGVSLFPNRIDDIETDCSCPDWSNPCKHIAAVYYILGEEFDRDPFLIFKLRGMERAEMMKKLSGGEEAVPTKNKVDSDSETQTFDRGYEDIQVCGFLSDPKGFWEGGTLPTDFLIGTNLSSLRATLLKQLGDFPFWRGEENILKTLEPVYEKASEFGARLVVGLTKEE